MPRKKKDNQPAVLSCVVDSRQSALLQSLAFYLKYKWNSMDNDLSDRVEVYEPTKSNGDVMQRYRLYFNTKKKVIAWNYANSEAVNEEVRFTFKEIVESFVQQIAKE